jgi:hypothetical protein
VNQGTLFADGRDLFQQRLTAALKKALTPEMRAAEYTHRWKVWPLKGGPQIPALRAKPRPTIAALAGWATPSATAWGDTPETHLARKEAARAAGKSMGLVVSNLDAQARLTSPADSGTPSTSSTAATAKSGVLNPAFSLWLMGLPSAWLTAAPAKASHEVNSCAGSGTP